MTSGSVGEYDIHYEPKPYKLKLLGKLVVQHGIRVGLIPNPNPNPNLKKK